MGTYLNATPLPATEGTHLSPGKFLEVRKPQRQFEGAGIEDVRIDKFAARD